MQYCALGSLIECLQPKYPDRRKVLEAIELRRQIASGIARGLDYLHNSPPSGIIHGDLAARNVLLNEKFEPRLSDFGMSISSAQDVNIASDAQIALRWLAPEVIQHNKFGMQADVWALGITLFELHSLGQRPYAEMTNAEFSANLRGVQEGSIVLQQPSTCPQADWELIQECLNVDPDVRPTSADMRYKLDQCARRGGGGGGGGGELTGRASSQGGGVPNAAPGARASSVNAAPGSGGASVTVLNQNPQMQQPMYRATEPEVYSALPERR